MLLAPCKGDRMAVDSSLVVWLCLCCNGHCTLLQCFSVDDHQCSCFPPHSFSCVNLIHSKRSQARGNFRAFRGFDSFILLRERRRLYQKSHAVSCLVGHVSCLHARSRVDRSMVCGAELGDVPYAWWSFARMNVVRLVTFVCTLWPPFF